MHQGALTISVLACLGLISATISRFLRALVRRREIKRLKADFAKLQNAVSHLEQMKSVVTKWAQRSK